MFLERLLMFLFLDHCHYFNPQAAVADKRLANGSTAIEDDIMDPTVGSSPLSHVVCNSSACASRMPEILAS